MRACTHAQAARVHAHTHACTTRTRVCWRIACVHTCVSACTHVCMDAAQHGTVLGDVRCGRDSRDVRPCHPSLPSVLAIRPCHPSLPSVLAMRPCHPSLPCVRAMRPCKRVLVYVHAQACGRACVRAGVLTCISVCMCIHACVANESEFWSFAWYCTALH